ncbi:hypothetical protein ATE49_01570 [Elizabethkingia miricola]|uniref:Uncharacterized protein n=1 Tax=Elizabethkingia miricola TaxID=172045 RepID=A0ABY3NIZ6_ELIMR|nr:MULTISPECIES: hypothetical protein [Elizabethkingia]OBS14069.1 hypothetical protein ATE49_01570 [Elizabethkingia miricola]TYO93128.1 hypothetical protein LX74_01193 [Elizabethkingia miricola]
MKHNITILLIFASFIGAYGQASGVGTWTTTVQGPIAPTASNTVIENQRNQNYINRNRDKNYAELSNYNDYLKVKESLGDKPKKLKEQVLNFIYLNEQDKIQLDKEMEKLTTKKLIIEKDLSQISDKTSNKYTESSKKLASINHEIDKLNSYLKQNAEENNKLSQEYYKLPQDKK